MRLKSWQRKTAKPVSERAAPGFLSSPDHPLPWPLASNSKPSRNFLKSLVPSVQTLAWYVNLSNRLEVFSMTLFSPHGLFLICNNSLSSVPSSADIFLGSPLKLPCLYFTFTLRLSWKLIYTIKMPT